MDILDDLQTVNGNIFSTDLVKRYCGFLSKCMKRRSHLSACIFFCPEYPEGPGSQR
jgi:hypothetical protein